VCSAVPADGGLLVIDNGVYGDRVLKIARAHGGLTRPLFVGYDLEDGVLMVARDGQGAIWRDAYFVRLHEPPYAGAGRARLRLERVALEDAWRCDCVARYVGGASPESLWQ